MRFKAGLNKMNFRLVTQSGVVGVSIFNRAFMKKDLEVGIGITVIGKYDKKKNIITASEIKLSPLSNKVKIEAVYHSTSGLTVKNLSTYINMADIAADNSCKIVMGMLEDMTAEEAASDTPDGQPVEAVETEEVLTEAEAAVEKTA